MLRCNVFRDRCVSDILYSIDWLYVLRTKVREPIAVRSNYWYPLVGLVKGGFRPSDYTQERVYTQILIRRRELTVVISRPPKNSKNNSFNRAKCKGEASMVNGISLI